MKRVLVLMSTYNGEKYLEGQIQSIIKQQEVDVSLLVRDDGSTDRTREILSLLQKENSKITCVFGENIGYEKSFMELVYISGDYDYYAFADQDDVWMEQKLSRALSFMEPEAGPVMYYSMMTQVDADLKKMEQQQELHKPLGTKAILFQNFVQGSTIVFNHQACEAVKSYRLKRKIAHDVWIPCLLTYIGKVFFDPNSYILYRKHEAAVTVKMLKGSYLTRFIRRVRGGEKVDNLAAILLEGYASQIKEEERIFLEEVAGYRQSFRTRMRLVLNPTVKKNSLKGTVMLKTAFLLGKVE